MAKIKVAKIRISRFSMFGSDRPDRVTDYHTLDYFLNQYFSYTLDCGRSYQYERGNSKISDNIRSFKSLVTNLNKAKANSCTHYQSKFYYLESEGFIDSKNLPKDFNESKGFDESKVIIK